MRVYYIPNRGNITTKGLVQDSGFVCRVKRVKRVTRRWARDPQKPFKGIFNVRIPSDLHRKAAARATMMGVSLISSYKRRWKKR